MIADMLAPGPRTVPQTSNAMSTPKPSISSFAAATQYRYRATPVLTIIDMNPDEKNREQVESDDVELEETKFSKTPSALKFKPEPKNVRVMNLAENLDLTPDTNPRKSSVKFKHKTLEWVLNQGHFLTRQSAQGKRAIEHSAPNQEQLNDHADIALNLSPTGSNATIPAQEFSFTQIDDASNSRYKSLTGARADLHSAFSSIPWCYHGAEGNSKLTNLPADTADMPNQLTVRSVRHLQKAHRTGISRPGTCRNSSASNEDEIDELKRMSTPILHQAVREAVGLGLMSVHESRILLEVISRRGPEELEESEETQPEDSEKDSSTSSSEATKPEDTARCLHMVGLCDPVVGFEPVDITYRPPSTKKPQAKSEVGRKVGNNSPRKEEVLQPPRMSEHVDSHDRGSVSFDTSIEDREGIDFGHLDKDLSISGTPRSAAEETPGCIARPCTAAESELLE